MGSNRGSGHFKKKHEFQALFEILVRIVVIIIAVVIIVVTSRFRLRTSRTFGGRISGDGGSGGSGGSEGGFRSIPPRNCF